MKNVALLFLAVAIFAVAGCQSDGNGARPLPAAVQQKQARFQSMYKSVDGDWSRLSWADQNSFAADFTNGDVGNAQILWGEMGRSDFPTQTRGKHKRN